MAYAPISIPSIAITTAVTAQVINIGQIQPGSLGLLVQSVFTYGSGGTTAKFYLQSSADGGTTWFDIASFAHTTASLRRVAGFSGLTNLAITATTDGSLTDNSVLTGPVGGLLRLKYTTVGTYAGSTSYKMDITPL